MECHVCLEAFDAAERRPKVLPCGHTFCFRCLQGLETRLCPLDQKVFQSAPEDLVNNYTVLQLCTKPAAPACSYRMWCRTCGKEADEVCVDEHYTCSLKKARTEEAAPLLVELQQLGAGLDQLGQTLDDAAQALDVEATRAKLQRAKDDLVAATGRLQDKMAADGVWTEAKKAAAQNGLSRSAAQLAADLADPSTKCKMMVQRGEAGGVAWSGEVRPAESAAARLLLCQLACHGGLQQQGQLQAGVEEPCLSTSGKILDVASESSKMDIKAMTSISSRSDLSEVRCLLGLHCRPSPPWSLKLLQRLAPNLEGLQLVSPEQRHLDLVLAMPRLQALCITGVTGEQLRQVAQMASLRRLQVHGLQSPLQELPATALKWLCGPRHTVLGLVRASADTLEELQLVAASTGRYYYPDLVQLRSCGLKKLQKFVLLRTAYSGSHDVGSCRNQKVAVWNTFLDDGMNVAIACSECDKDESSVCGNARPTFLGETKFA